VSIPRTGEIEQDGGPMIGLATWQARSAPGMTPPLYFRWKGILDRVLAAILLIPGLPIIGALVLLVRRTSRGPGIFVQIRVGKDGREFKLYKLRTMIDHAEDVTGPVWAQVADPRVTPVGQILRKFHLDEFPQLFNILKGEMSLIGPRPERPEFVHVLARRIPGYLDRLAVRPGVTGLAQLNLPPDSDLESVRKKLELELDYIESAGLLLDLRVLLCTFLRLFKVPEGLTIRLFGLDRLLRGPGHRLPGTDGSDGADTSPLNPESIAGKARSHGSDGDGRASEDGRAPSLHDASSFEPRKPR
jgi:lipopolysaccharide/colanic/teichoic acid biosynthesis glycosyltransferase